MLGGGGESVPIPALLPLRSVCVVFPLKTRSSVKWKNGSVFRFYMLSLEETFVEVVHSVGMCQIGAI